MIYLEEFRLPSSGRESDCFDEYSYTYYTSIYPFQIFPNKGISNIRFSDITIFCGGNGSGKSTLLNIISENLNLKRQSRFNTTELFDTYVELTDSLMRIDMDKVKRYDVMEQSRIITSDDVFNHILAVRERNARIDFKREVILDEIKRVEIPRTVDFTNPESIKAYKRACDFTRLSKSESVRRYAEPNERTLSNGENGYNYFTNAIQPGGIYLLDEPENSLSAELQIELSHYIAGMARFHDCQFIISSHSPFMLAMYGAKIYDLDAEPVAVRRWTELPAVRTYYDFFKTYAEQFESEE